MENGEEQTELEQEAKELLNTITDAIKHFLYLSYSINSMLENKLPQKDIDFFKEAYNRHFFLMMKYSQLDKEFYYDAINCKVIKLIGGHYLESGGNDRKKGNQGT